MTYYHTKDGRAPLFWIRAHHVAEAGLEFGILLPLPLTSQTQCARITSVSHHAYPKLFFIKFLCELISYA
jgi:hypothetical protein